MDCSNCDKFEAYEYSESVRLPDNCVTFMTNSGGCPRKKEILNNATPEHRFFETELSKNILLKLNFQNNYITSVLVNKYKDLKISYIRNGKIISNIVNRDMYELSRFNYLAEVVNLMEIKYLEEYVNEKSNISRV